MPPKIIVSYDGTANEDDAITLGRVFRNAGADVSIAYVRHTHEPDSNRETLAQAEAQDLLERGVQLLGDANVQRHVVTDRSTPEGLAALAQRESADVVVFCSDSHTAKGHVAVGNSAERLLEGGSVAVAIAPVDLARAARAALDQPDRRRRRRRRRRSRDRRVARRGVRRRGCAGRQREHRRARVRLAPRGGARPDLAQLLSRTPDRDRDGPCARAPARGRAVVRAQRRRRRLSGVG